MKITLNRSLQLTRLIFCMRILFFGITLCSVNSFGLEIGNPKKSTNQTTKKINPVLKKVETQQDTGDRAALKVVPRPKIPLGQLAIFKDGKYIFITTKKVDKLEISTNCFEAKSSCTALDVGQTKVTSLQSPTGQVSNPASTLCEQLLGKNFIAIDSKGSEFDYCGFHDGSFVDTWTLLSKVMQK